MQRRYTCSLGGTLPRPTHTRPSRSAFPPSTNPATVTPSASPGAPVAFTRRPIRPRQRASPKPTPPNVAGERPRRASLPARLPTNPRQPARSHALRGGRAGEAGWPKELEAAGIEPASRDTPAHASTCVGRPWISPTRPRRPGSAPASSAVVSPDPGRASGSDQSAVCRDRPPQTKDRPRDCANQAARE